MKVSDTRELILKADLAMVKMTEALCAVASSFTEVGRHIHEFNEAYTKLTDKLVQDEDEQD